MSKRLILGIGIFVVAAVSRMIPHYPNFTPIESIALFGGAYLTVRHFSYLLPLIAIYLTDLILNNTLLRSYFPEEQGIIWFSDYMIYTGLAIVGIALIGKMIRNKIKPVNVLLASFSGSVLFFLVSNFGVWMHSVTYSKSWEGLLQCYAMALPFFRNSLVSGILFSAVLFGVYELISTKVLVTEKSVQ